MREKDTEKQVKQLEQTAKKVDNEGLKKAIERKIEQIKDEKPVKKC